MKTLYLILCFASCCCLCSLVEAQENAFRPKQMPASELWLGHYNPERLGTPGNNWDRAIRIIDGIEFYLNMIAYKVPQSELEPFCKQARSQNVQIGVNGGYFDWQAMSDQFDTQGPDAPIRETVRMEMVPGVGAETARIEIRKLDNLIRAAGKIDVITLDGPIRRLMYPGADTGRVTPKGEAMGFTDRNDAVTEIIGYMRAWQEVLPEVRFVVLTNFPNWGWQGEMAYWGSGPNGMYWGDYQPAIAHLIQSCREADVPLDAVRVDNPYEFATGTFELRNTKWPQPIIDPATIDWTSRILQLEQLTRDAGLRFDLIVNSENGGATSNQAFSEKSLEYLDLYHRIGGRPDRYILEGWFQYPDQVGPDSQPYTLTHLARQFHARISEHD